MRRFPHFEATLYFTPSINHHFPLRLFGSTRFFLLAVKSCDGRGPSARPRPEGGAGGSREGRVSCHSYQWVESGVEPSTSFRFGSGWLGQEITERESGFIGVAASEDGGGGGGAEASSVCGR